MNLHGWFSCSACYFCGIVHCMNFFHWIYWAHVYCVYESVVCACVLSVSMKIIYQFVYIKIIGLFIVSIWCHRVQNAIFSSPWIFPFLFWILLGIFSFFCPFCKFFSPHIFSCNFFVWSVKSVSYMFVIFVSFSLSPLNVCVCICVILQSFLFAPFSERREQKNEWKSFEVETKFQF